MNFFFFALMSAHDHMYCLVIFGSICAPVRKDGFADYYKSKLNFKQYTTQL